MKLAFRIIGYAVAIPVVVILLVLIVPTEQSTAKNPSEATIESAEVTAAEVEDLKNAIRAAIPDHWYSVKDGQHYAYEAKDSSELLRVRYLGVHDGLHKILFSENRSIATMMECAKDCEYVKAYEFWKGKLESETMHKMQAGTILWEAFQDAWNGKLDRYHNKEGKYLVLDRDGPQWVDQ